MAGGRRRSRTVSYPELAKQRQNEPVPPPHWRPRLRGQCAEGRRPCPYVSCRYHLGLELRKQNVRLNFVGDDPSSMRETCALDVADTGAHSQMQVAGLIGLSRACVNSVEERALRKLRAYHPALADALLSDGEPPTPE